MNRLRAAGYVFIKSLTSPKYTQDIIKTGFSFSLKYFAVLALLASIAVFSVAAQPLYNDLTNVTNILETSIIQTYPEDLVITLQGGELSINQPEPYFFTMPEDETENQTENGKNQANQEQVVETQSTEEQPAENPAENLIVFDSQGTIEDLETYDTLILVNRTNLLIRGSNKVEVYPLSDYPDGQITSRDIADFVAQVRPFLNALPYIVLTLAFLGMIVYYFGFRLVYLLAIALVLMIFGAIRGLKLTYSKYYQVAIHAITLPLIIEVASDVFGFAVNYPFWFFVLNVLIGIIGLAAVDAVDTSKQA